MRPPVWQRERAGAGPGTETTPVRLAVLSGCDAALYHCIGHAKAMAGGKHGPVYTRAGDEPWQIKTVRQSLDETL